MELVPEPWLFSEESRNRSPGDFEEASQLALPWAPFAPRRARLRPIEAIRVMDCFSDQETSAMVDYLNDLLLRDVFLQWTSAMRHEFDVPVTVTAADMTA